MKIEMHAHTSGVSLCSLIPPQQLPQALLAAGIDGAVLTNHYAPYHMDALSSDIKTSVDKFIDEYRTFKRSGDKIGFKTFFGAEVSLLWDDGHLRDFVLYGIDENFLKDNLYLYRYSQRALFELCQTNGVIMVQAHPFREEHFQSPANPKYLNGVEINCHPYFLRNEERVRQFAADNGLIVTCGGDVHYLEQCGSCAMTVPDDIVDARDLSLFLSSGVNLPIFYK